jgi:hypothetical protein
VIGMSEGNGHPYSWSAIFNGYNKDYMKGCPFPVIPEYLSKQNFPEDTIKDAVVSHIWTQDIKVSKHIALASNIENICENLEDMLDKVDGFLLARDDAENHKQYVDVLVKTGKPIYIDKPICLSKKELDYYFDIEKNNNQLFSCSAIRFSKEFNINNLNLTDIGEIEYIDSYVMKSWEKYSIHIIEPVVDSFFKNDKIKNINSIKTNSKNSTTVLWRSGMISRFNTFDKIPTPIKIELYGTKGQKTLIFEDTFYAFKNALIEFLNYSFYKKNYTHNKDILFKSIKILEGGLK